MRSAERASARMSGNGEHLAGAEEGQRLLAEAGDRARLAGEARHAPSRVQSPANRTMPSRLVDLGIADPRGAEIFAEQLARRPA